MASEPPKVLISYSHDSPEHAERVLELANRLRGDGVDCTIDQYVLVPEEGWPLWMERQIRDSNFVLMVCTETYLKRVLGEEQPGKGLGVRWEGNLIYNAIYSAGVMNTKFIPLLFVARQASHIPTPLQGTTFYEPLTEAGYEKLYRRLSNQPQAEKQELGKLRRLPTAEHKSEGALGRLVNVPDLPPHFLPRLGDFLALKDTVLAGLTKPVALTGSGKIGVQGMGGIGKTVLAAALTHDPQVRQAFPDGIYWLTIGQKPNLLDLQNQLLRQLTGSKETLTTEEEAKDALRQALEGRSALLVLDDVWNVDHAAAFAVTAPPARLLVTTRNSEVLVGLEAEEHRVDVLSPSDALKMLTEWVGEEISDTLPPEASEVARECGYLPLALAMIGAMIRLQPTAWKDALDCLRASDLEEIKRAFPGYPYPNLLRAIEVSVEALDAPDRECYLDLAVFPEDQPIPETALSILWKLEARRTRDCMSRLVARSLATRSRTVGHETLLLHDLQRDLIYKRRERKLPGLHLRLLEAWDALPKLPDTYAWRWIAYHLIQAGRKEDLRRLLVDFDYLQAKLFSTDSNALIADYYYLREDKDLQLVQSAIRLSAHVLARDAPQLPGQLTGRLFSNTAPGIQALLKQAGERKAWPGLRPLTSSLFQPGGHLVRTLEGHTLGVDAVAILGDNRAISASTDKTLRVWDLDSGQTLRTLQGHTGKVNAVAVTHESHYAISASTDKTLRVWDLKSGQILRTLQGHTDSVCAVAITADGHCALSASADCTLRLWDLETGQTIRILQGHTDSVWAVAIMDDGHRAVSGSADCTLRLWDLDSGQTIRTLQGHTSEVWAVAITADERSAVSASADRTLRLWDLESAKTIRTLQGHRDAVRVVAVTLDGHRAVSGSKDGTLRVWDLATGHSLQSLEAHSDKVNAVALTPSGKRAVSASDDRTLRVWDLETSQAVPTLGPHSNKVNVVAITPDGCRAVSASDDHTLRVWDSGTGQILHTLIGHTNDVNAVAITPNSCCAISASHDDTLRVWNLESGRCLCMLEGHTSAVGAVAVTPDGRRAVSASTDKTLRMWDLESGRCLCTLEGHGNAVIAVAVTSDGRRAVSASTDKTLRVWDLESGQTLRTLEGHTDWVNAVAVTPDGQRAVSASGDGTLRLWDLGTGQTLRTLEGHTGRVRAVAVTLDGGRALSGSSSWDYTLRLWDLESGQMIRTLQGHRGQVETVAITPNGRRAVSGSADKTLRVWDLESEKELAIFTGEGRMLSCAIAPDGQTIIVGDESGRVHFLRLVEADPTKPAIGETRIQLLHHKEQAS